MTPTGWTVSKRGNSRVIVFENKSLQAVVSMSEFQFARFTRESMRLLGIREKNEEEK